MIEIEDTFLHPDMPLLVWCMGVSDYAYSMEILESILQIVSDLACGEYLDTVSECESVDVYRLWKEPEVLVRSILVRGFYRGMAGDVKMLQDYAQVWHERLKTQQWRDVIEKVYEGLPVWTQEDMRGGFLFEDAVVEGVDFHCSNMIEELMNEPGLTSILESLGANASDYLRSAIWNHRSKLNVRKSIGLLAEASGLGVPCLAPTDPQDPIFESHIRPLVDSFSILYLQKRFKSIKSPLAQSLHL